MTCGWRSRRQYIRTLPSFSVTWWSTNSGLFLLESQWTAHTCNVSCLYRDVSHSILVILRETIFPNHWRLSIVVKSFLQSSAVPMKMLRCRIGSLKCLMLRSSVQSLLALSSSSSASSCSMWIAHITSNWNCWLHHEVPLDITIDSAAIHPLYQRQQCSWLTNVLNNVKEANRPTRAAHRFRKFVQLTTEFEVIACVHVDEGMWVSNRWSDDIHSKRYIISLVVLWLILTFLCFRKLSASIVYTPQWTF